MLKELSEQFSTVGEDIMAGIQACNPTSPSFLSEDVLKHIANHYKIVLRHRELLVARNFLGEKMEKKDIPDTATVYQILTKMMTCSQL